MSPDCACKAVQLAYGLCVGELTTCTVRCSSIERVSVAREAYQPTCWEKATGHNPAQKESP